MKNKIITSEGNVQFQFPDGKIVNVHPNHLYTVFNEDTVSFILIALPPSSGLAIMASKAEDLELDGQTYSIADLPNAVSEAFAEAGAQARCEIVDELPTTGKTNTIYLVPKEEGEGYDEYIYLKDEQRWELVGDTSIEMDNYLKKVDFNAYSANTQTVINSISGAIDTEISNREAADAVISGAVDTLSTDLSNEVQRAQNAESALDSKINAVSGNVDDVQAEVDVLSADLEDEVSARTDADTALSNKIDGKVVELTQAEYDSLVDKNPSVLYVITDAVEVNMNDYYKKTETSGATEIQTAFDAKLNTSDFNTYSANTQTAINGKANSADVYTKSQVYTKSEVDEAIAEIDLSDIEDRISEDEEVTASGLNALNDKFGGLKLMKISQSDYDNLQVKDNNTLYIISD